MRQPNVKGAIRELIAEQGSVRNADVAARSSISRQSAHGHLRALVRSGELVREGAGRSVRYRASRAETSNDDTIFLERTAGWSRGSTRIYNIRGLEEDRVWTDLVRNNAVLANLNDAARSILHYAITELVNNAIDHSAAETVEVRISSNRSMKIAVEVIDHGVGVFDHVRNALGLETNLVALQELSKGRVTTQPERHTGEGLFFVSKSVDWFELDSGSLRWVVDNEIRDMAVGRGEHRPGTRVRIEVSTTHARSLRAVFDEYTSEHEFVRTRAVLKLLTYGARFISRSEAKRLLNGLEKFREVLVDFNGVDLVGQGFADEVFRVWARSHPETRLAPENMIEPVEFMVRRAQRARDAT